MCVMSAVFDYGRNIPAQQWTVPGLNEFHKLIDQAGKFDEAAGEPNCEDPSKAEWLKSVEERLSKLESKKEGAPVDLLVELKNDGLTPPNKSATREKALNLLVSIAEDEDLDWTIRFKALEKLIEVENGS